MNPNSLTLLSRCTLLLLLVPTFGCRGGDRADTRAEAPVAGVEVTEIRLGRSVGVDRRVATETTQFGPRDTIYASVATQGSANNVALTARWTYQDGQVVDESRQTISPTGPTNTEFHVANPGGWPPGDYRVEILVNGRPAETRAFTVR